MDLIALSGAATIALVGAILFLVIIRSWNAFTHATTTTRFPKSIMKKPHKGFGTSMKNWAASSLSTSFLLSFF